MATYEQHLDDDPKWALKEGSMHFEKGSAVHKALEKIVRRLDDLGIPYAIAGGMALFFHGYRRFTEDVDILVTPDGLRRIHEELIGPEYLAQVEGSKGLRDTQNGVRIDFIVTGDYPGDGKPKPVVFPDPEEARTQIEKVHCLPLPKLIELKLVSGSCAGRLRDLGDVQELIRILKLPADFAEQLDPSVKDSFAELWTLVRQTPPDP